MGIILKYSIGIWNLPPQSQKVNPMLTTTYLMYLRLAMQQAFDSRPRWWLKHPYGSSSGIGQTLP